MESTKKMIYKSIKYILSTFFAFIILYFLFRNQDPIKLISEIKKVDIIWVLLSMLFGAWAYVSRGLRWIILLRAMGYNSSKLNSIASVSIGYFTNLFIPRAGEISRCTSLNQIEKIPVNKLFGTILIERVIDFVSLIILMLIAFIVKFEAILMFYTTIIQQNRDGQEGVSLMNILIVILLCVLVFYTIVKKSKMTNKIKSFYEDLKEGFKSISHIKNKKLFWFHTMTIWIMYFLMTYICFFCMKETSNLTTSDGLFLLMLGGIGMVIPTPGGIGSYHAIVMTGLAILGVGFIDFNTKESIYNPALLFPTIIHAAQTLVAIIMGIIGIIILFLSKKNNIANS